MRKYICLLLFFCVICSGVLFADTWDAPSSYYNSATGTGSTLKSQLRTIMSANHTQRKYGDFRYSAAITDRDPDNSSKILLCYNRASVSKSWDSGNTWNREHVWPQSFQSGDANNSSKGNLGDPHALLPCNPDINSSRGNKYFSGATLTGNYRSAGSYWFPGDDDKGDIARSLFYSSTRYSMTLVNGSPSGNQMGDLAALLRWHYMDPPDTFERRRNHTIYSSAYNSSYYTNNRNAFIDHPEFVWSVFGGNDNDTMLYVESSHETDGSSSVIFDLGTISSDDLSSIDDFTVTLNKIGNDGTYYEITTSDNVTCSGATEGYAFDYGTKSTTLTISLTALETEDGDHSETVTINNLDVCGNSPAGRGSNDGNDVITINYTIGAEYYEADFNEDGYVNGVDFFILIDKWLQVDSELNISDGPDDTTDIINIHDFAKYASQVLYGY